MRETNDSVFQNTRQREKSYSQTKILYCYNQINKLHSLDQQAAKYNLHKAALKGNSTKRKVHSTHVVSVRLDFPVVVFEL